MLRQTSRKAAAKRSGPHTSFFWSEPVASSWRSFPLHHRIVSPFGPSSIVRTAQNPPKQKQQGLAGSAVKTDASVFAHSVPKHTDIALFWKDQKEINMDILYK